MTERMLEKCAKAVFKLLDEETTTYCQRDNGDLSDVSVDGIVDLYELVLVVLQAAREPTEELLDHPSYMAGEWSRRSVEAYIDTILEEEKP